jgi:iron complex outermembrane receptor protein
MHSDFSDETAPHAGVAVRGAGWTFFGNAARGVNYPGVYAPGIAASTLDLLEAETLDHVEAGAQWRSRNEQAMLGLSLFRDRTDNLLQWTPAGLLNVGSADADGAEITAHLRPCDQLALYAGMTLLDPEDSRTPRAPDWTASAGASVSVTRRLQVHADVDAVAEQYTFNGRASDGERLTAEEVDRYTIGNLRITYTPVLAEKGRVTVFAGCDNIADVSYETLAGYPLPGRFYSGGVRVAL